MKKTLKYSLIRFIPYARREEFVNIGVVGLCEQTGELAFVLNDVRKTGRVHGFFPTLKGKNLFKEVLRLAEDELLRVQKFMPQSTNKQALFSEVVKPKDGLLQYSTIRVKFLADGQTLQQALAVLNQDLVSFESENYTSQNHDAELARIFKKTVLAARQLDQVYKEKRLVREEFGVKATLPFYESGHLTSIKPLSFSGYDQANKVTEHALNWMTHLNGLMGADLLQPEKHLIVYDDSAKPELKPALNFALKQFEKLNVKVANSQDSQTIGQFLDQVRP